VKRFGIIPPERKAGLVSVNRGAAAAAEAMIAVASVAATSDGILIADPVAAGAVVGRDRRQRLLLRVLGKLLAALLQVASEAAQAGGQPGKEPGSDDPGDGRSVTATSQAAAEAVRSFAAAR
jgi:hypothetical protein